MRRDHLSLPPSGSCKTDLSEEKGEHRIVVTLRLPKEIAHALIDASAERWKNREQAWNQQDIVAEALADGLKSD